MAYYPGTAPHSLRYQSLLDRSINPQSEQPIVNIPLEELSEDAIAGIIEAFVLREGTDYGHREVDLASKCAAVRRQLEAGEAEICFDPETQSIDIRLSGR